MFNKTTSLNCKTVVIVCLPGCHYGCRDSGQPESKVVTSISKHNGRSEQPKAVQSLLYEMAVLPQGNLGAVGRSKVNLNHSVTKINNQRSISESIRIRDSIEHEAPPRV